MGKVSVLIVDDSALIRDLLTEILEADEDITVVGTARDPYVARDKIKELNPDVLTLDVEMPRMDGLTFLRNLMRLRPMPVVMISSLTEQGAQVTLDSLEAGAVDYMPKPQVDVTSELTKYADEIVEKVKGAARTKPRPRKRPPRVVPKLSADAILDKGAVAEPVETTDRLIAIGASTGGTEAIKDVLMDLPADTPGVVITQHIPGAFSKTFAQRVNALSQMSVKEASEGDIVFPGHVYIAPGESHLVLDRKGSRFVCRLNNGPLVNRHRPSVDVLFRSVAQLAGSNAIGVLLTGMGDDGAQGLREMQEAGAPTVIQDEETSVVWGMPGAAHALGAADTVLPLEKIAKKITSLVQEQTNA